KQRKGDEAKQDVTPELLDRERGEDDCSGAQLEVTFIEEPQINRDAGSGDPDHSARRQKNDKAKDRGDQEISPSSGHGTARAEQMEDDVPRQILKDADGEEIGDQCL